MEPVDRLFESFSADESHRVVRATVTGFSKNVDWRDSWVLETAGDLSLVLDRRIATHPKAPGVPAADRRLVWLASAPLPYDNISSDRRELGHHDGRVSRGESLRLQQALQSNESSPPEFARRVSRATQTTTDFLEAKEFSAAQKNRHFFIGRQTFYRCYESTGLLLRERAGLRCLIRVYGLVADLAQLEVCVERQLTSDASLTRIAIPPDVVSDDMLQYRPQPSAEIDHIAPGEPREPAVRFKQRLLHYVRVVAFASQHCRCVPPSD